ncbi:cytoskeletal protein CcmA (bactofilin family) [Dysgonomonadaceae bacterium PH5-43]|nr:cytoskeletal protein CcmA (bactofilin family) [Dysgonomonadaceae bacterium PH5-43]
MKIKESGSLGASYNALAQGTVIIGNIKATDDLRIDGKIEGVIECSGRVVIGSNAEIKGDIHCTSIDLLGTVNGNLFAKETFTMRTSGTFTGEATIGGLEIEPGATFNGICKMQ